jgi:ATP-binding cassette subfamily F protein uup
MPPPILLGCQGISKAFGSRPLFSELTFAVHEGDHIGLVGPNGAGKSTLLKILAGIEVPDEGACTRRKNLRVGYVPQNPTFAQGTTVAAVVAQSFSASPLEMEEKEQRVAVALSRAGFADPSCPADTLSGGWRTRLAIARALAADPEVLLLDEPTNHLDLESRLWLESLLGGSSEACVVVSHDRYFLQSVGRRMFEIDRIFKEGMIEVDGTYADLLEKRVEILSNQASYEESLANRVRREIAWLRRGAKARTRKSKARMDAAQQAIDELKDSRERSVTQSAGLDLNATGRRTKRLWHGIGLTKRFGPIVIVEGLELLLTPGMRLGVLGPNGSGKTTLLRMIVGELPPDAGEVHRADGLRIVYFDQNRATLDLELSLKRSLAPDGDTVVYRDGAVHVATWAKRFLFRPDQLETPVSRLSGGERARIVLARLMLQPADLLVLDEPTNDLDIPTLEVLEESLLEFPGALVLVTHDRHLLDRVSTTILALDGKGGVERFADYGQWEAKARARVPATKEGGRPENAKAPRGSSRKLSYLEQAGMGGHGGEGSRCRSSGGGGGAAVGGPVDRQRCHGASDPPGGAGTRQARGGPALPPLDGAGSQAGIASAHFRGCATGTLGRVLPHSEAGPRRTTIRVIPSGMTLSCQSYIASAWLEGPSWRRLRSAPLARGIPPRPPCIRATSSSARRSTGPRRTSRRT